MERLTSFSRVWERHFGRKLLKFLGEIFFNSCTPTRKAHINFAKENNSYAYIVSKCSAADPEILQHEAELP